MKSLFVATVVALLASVSHAQTAPAAAVDSTAHVAQSVKKPAKKHAHKVSATKHKAAKHKKAAAL